MNLQNIRQEYSQKSLSKSLCPAEPMAFFDQWLNEAMNAKVNEAYRDEPCHSGRKRQAQ